MTRKQTLAAIRALGMRATYDAACGEYRVTFAAADMPSAERREAVACYCVDSEDAVGTATDMARRAGVTVTAVATFAYCPAPLPIQAGV